MVKPRVGLYSPQCAHNGPIQPTILPTMGLCYNSHRDTDTHPLAPPSPHVLSSPSFFQSLLHALNMASQRARTYPSPVPKATHTHTHTHTLIHTLGRSLTD